MLLALASETLNLAETIKLIGINISKNLDWSTHVESITAGHSLGNLHKANKPLDADELAILYKTKVKSHMEYCGLVWQNATKTVSKKLDDIKSKACRFLDTKRDACLKFNFDSYTISYCFRFMLDLSYGFWCCSKHGL